MIEFLHHGLAYLIPFLLILTVLVFVHELGHYLVARWNRVRVEVFSIGFGPEIIGWTDRSGTRWKVSLLPFGGYVRMFGEMQEEAAERPPLSEADKAVSFSHKSLRQRAAIVVAGPLANFLLAIVVSAVLFATVGQQLTSTVVGEVVPDSAAATAGIQPGDKIVALNGRPVSHFEDVAAVVMLGLGEPLHMKILRAGKPLDITATPKVVEQVDIFGDTHRIGLLGITSGKSGEIVHYDPATAVYMAVVENYPRTVDMLKAIGQIIQGIRPSNEVGGVLRIAKMSGD